MISLVLNVGFDIPFVFLINLLPVQHVHSTLEQPALDAHTSYLVHESSLTNSIPSADLDILGLLSITRELLKHLICFLPAPEHRISVGLEFVLDVVCLSEGRGEVLKGACDTDEHILLTVPVVDADVRMQLSTTLSDLFAEEGE